MANLLVENFAARGADLLVGSERSARWLRVARPEQRPPDGAWRVWYIRGGRGSGKTRAGAETLAGWIREHDDGEWMIVAPTYGDARKVCIEGESGLLRALEGEVESWNRSEGVLTTKTGAKVFADGADDGALRVQGHNLRGVWADEVGLWRDWDRAWNYSIRPAVRHDPARIIATGTPKMAHPLIKHLLAAPNVAVTVMKTSDNVANLDERAVADLYEQFEGSTLGRQELDGEYIEALEGAILNRHHWEFFPADHPVRPADLVGIVFDQIIHSWDTALKAKTSSDNVAGQVWGCIGPDRYLLRLWCGHATLEGTVLRMRELLAWGREEWPDVPHRVIVETASNGADAIAEMHHHVDGVFGINARDGGDKVRRVMTATPALETRKCHLPGWKDHDQNGRGYDSRTPAEVQAFVEECAMFQADMSHAYDDQVDAWSQMINWARGAGPVRSSLARPGKGRMIEAGHLPALAGRPGFGLGR